MSSRLAMALRAVSFIFLLLLFVYSASCACSSYTNCLSCTNDATCSWCGATSSCIASTSYCSSCQKTDPSTCPPQSCGSISDCKNCTLSGCHWCGFNSKCLESDTSNPPLPCTSCGYSNDPTSLSTSCWKGQASQCPDVQSCSTLQDCSSCTNAGCWWCGFTRKCMEATANRTYQQPCSGQCGYSNDQTSLISSCFKGPRDQCPQQLCETLTDCKSCAAGGCYWCGFNQKCMEASNSSPAIPCGYQGAQCGYSNDNTSLVSSCWKGTVSQCPTNSSCEANTNCASCTAGGCYWCGFTKKCMEASSGIPPTPCGYKGTQCGYSNDNTSLVSSCWKGAQSLCPFVPSCENITDCTTCTSSGCYWCGQNRKCQEASAASVPAPCGYKGQQCGYSNDQESLEESCWKNVPSTCPAVSQCETLTNCTACINAKCHWCGFNKLCQEASAQTLPTPCGYKGEQCGYSADAESLADSCWKMDVNQCPDVAACESFTDCKSCAGQKNCKWCSTAQACSEISFGASDSPSGCGYHGEACSASSPGPGCWKDQQQQCPAAYCDALSCFDCTATAGCIWCAGSSSCIEMSFYQNSTCEFCGNQCLKDDKKYCPQSASTQQEAFCGNYTSCSACSQYSNCGWCATTSNTGICLEASMIGLGNCSSSCPLATGANWYYGQCATATSTGPTSTSGSVNLAASTPTALNSLSTDTITFTSSSSSSRSTSSSSTTSGPTPTPHHPHEPLPIWAIVVIAIGGVLLIAALAGVAVLLFVLKGRSSGYEPIH